MTWKTFDKIKACYLKVKKVCAYKVHTKELKVDSQTIDIESLKHYTSRGSMESIDISFPIQRSVEEDDQYQYVIAYFVGGFNKHPLNSINVHIGIDNDVLKIQEYKILGTLGYSSIFGQELYLYSPITRQWIGPQESLSIKFENIKPYAINSLTCDSPTGKIVNLQTFAVITPQEICDMETKQAELGEDTKVSYISWVFGTASAVPPNPSLVETQYSATYSKSWVCQSG